MVYHFVKHIGFDIKADSLEQAKEIAEAIDKYDGDYNGIEYIAYDTMKDAVNDVLDVGVLRDDAYDNCDAHAGKTEYVGCTDDEDDPEERLFDYLTDADEDEDDDDATYRLTDKGYDYLDFIEGKYPQFNAADYDCYGKRIRPRRDVDFADAIVNAIFKAFAEI